MAHKRIPGKHPTREAKVAGLVHQLIHSNLEWIGKVLLRITRLSSPKHPIQPENEPKKHNIGPTGPFIDNRKSQRGDLLAWVPRRFDSYMIDDITGQYGYSHIAVDCGETDLPTGKPVMLESMVGKTVQRGFIDEYGDRRFARIPLSKAGVNPEAFCACATSKLGEAYDSLEALTLGEIDDPAKQVCSDLAAVCIPEAMRKDIAKAYRVGLLKRRSVSVHSRPDDHHLKEFISPNGFAQYFGAPRGEKLTQADQYVDPRIVTHSPQPVLWLAIRWGLATLILAGAAWLLMKRPLNSLAGPFK